MNKICVVIVMTKDLFPVSTVEMVLVSYIYIIYIQYDITLSK